MNMMREIEEGLSINDLWCRREREHNDAVLWAIHAKNWAQVARLVAQHEEYVAHVLREMGEQREA